MDAAFLTALSYSSRGYGCWVGLVVRVLFFFFSPFHRDPISFRNPQSPYLLPRARPPPFAVLHRRERGRGEKRRGEKRRKLGYAICHHRYSKNWLGFLSSFRFPRLIAFPRCLRWCPHVWCNLDAIDGAAMTFVARERKTTECHCWDCCRRHCPYCFQGKP